MHTTAPWALEVTIQGRLTTFIGAGRYADAKLWIDVKDPEGDFTLLIDEATFDGEILAMDETLTIRLSAI